MSATVLIAAGGTGGHVFPALAVARELKMRGGEVHWLGTERGPERAAAEAEGIPFEAMPVRAVRQGGWLRRLSAALALCVSLPSTWLLMRRVRPSCVLGMGGYSAFAAGLAARLCGRALLIHEQNETPGLVNRLLAPLAAVVMTPSEAVFARSPKRVCTGNPVRADICDLAPPARRLAGRDGRLRLLILGGSQGALSLNRAVLALMRALPEAERPELLHQCGARHVNDCRRAYDEMGVEVDLRGFIDDMAAAYAWADGAVCRAGALTLAELAAVGLGAALAPLAGAADDHQRANARRFVAAGAAVCLSQRQLDDGELIALYKDWRERRSQLLAMAEAARKLARPEAAREVAALCMKERAA